LGVVRDKENLETDWRCLSAKGLILEIRGKGWVRVEAVMKGRN
jgi:hypothetical protein